MHPYRTFRRFSAIEDAHTFVLFLEANGIPAQYEKEPQLLDANILGKQIDADIMVKIPADYFEQANELLKDSIDADPEKVEPDYYLLAFTDRELLDVVSHEDEWGDYDFKLALALLEERGIPIDKSTVKGMQRKRIAELADPKEVEISLIVVGYVLALFGGAGLILSQVFAYALLLSGLFLGGVLAWSRTTLPNGDRNWSFAERARNHGVRMLVISVVMIPVWFGFYYFIFSRH